MKVKELAAPPEPLLTHPFASELSPKKQFELAAGTVLKAVKERTDPSVVEPTGSRTGSRALNDWLWRLLRSR